VREPEKAGKDVTASMLDSLCLEYAFDDEHFPILYENLVELAPEKARSRRYYQRVFAGWE
jgi:hypothetical protein